MISYGHWYYTQESYKDDHELSSYQPREDREARV